MHFKSFAAATLVVLSAMTNAHAFEGRYKGGAPGYDQGLVIEKTGENEYQIKAQVKTQGCTGSVEAAGTARDKTITAKDATGVCTITLLRAGPNLQLDQKQCTGFHGGTCDFSGTYAPR